MKLATTNYYLNKYGNTDGAKKMAEHGYTSVDYSLMNTEEGLYALRDDRFVIEVTRLRREIEAGGIKVDTVHGPWRYPCDATDSDRAERFEKMTKAMVIARYLGAKYMVVHPLMPYGVNSPEAPDEVYAINRQYFAALANVGKNLGITVCLENMPFTDFPLSTPERIAELVRDINSPYLKICFDTGHANMFGTPIGESVRELGELIAVVHAHDNFADDDTHNVPYNGTVDWMNFAEALFDIGFDGVISLECKPETEDEAGELGLAKTGRLIAGV